MSPPRSSAKDAPMSPPLGGRRQLLATGLAAGLAGALGPSLVAAADPPLPRVIVLNSREEAVSFYINHGYRVEGPDETLFGEVRHFRMQKEIG